MVCMESFDKHYEDRLNHENIYILVNYLKIKISNNFLNLNYLLNVAFIPEPSGN